MQCAGQLLRWSLKQPPIPLSGVLYEWGPVQQDQELQCGATVEGTSGLVTHRLTNLQTSRNPSAQQVSQTPFCIYCTVYSVHCCRVRLSTFYAELLCPICICLQWSQTQHLLCWVIVPCTYLVVESLLSLLGPAQYISPESFVRCVFWLNKSLPS